MRADTEVLPGLCLWRVDRTYFVRSGRRIGEGIQKKIEYADLQFISSFAMEKILDFQIWEEPGEHARGNFRLLLSENETGINSMNAPIQLLG